ncbi:hypothetical protein [Streptomyces hypolithicus]
MAEDASAELQQSTRQKEARIADHLADAATKPREATNGVPATTAVLTQLMLRRGVPPSRFRRAGVPHLAGHPPMRDLIQSGGSHCRTGMSARGPFHAAGSPSRPLLLRWQVAGGGVVDADAGVLGVGATVDDRSPSAYGDLAGGSARRSLARGRGRGKAEADAVTPRELGENDSAAALQGLAMRAVVPMAASTAGRLSAGFALHPQQHAESVFPWKA